MKIYLAYTNISDADVLFGVYSTNDKAVTALMSEEGLTKDEATALVQEAELDHYIGDN